MEIKVKRLDPDLPLPRKATEGSSGFDIYSRVDQVINPGEIKGIPAGIVLEIPEGYEVQVRPRSGLALKHGIGILNSPGTIDSDYRGEVVVILFNFSKEPFAIKKGDRIAQIVPVKLPEVKLIEADSLTDTSRGSGGFGSTGV
ncbi:dUTP diphosphatase [bacterium]|nr:MAG: dUTP diphosphatase [bacterium]